MKSEAEGYEAWSDLHVEFYLLTFQVDLLALKTIFQNSFCKRIFSVFSASSSPILPLYPLLLHIPNHTERTITLFCVRPRQHSLVTEDTAKAFCRLSPFLSLHLFPQSLGLRNYAVNIHSDIARVTLIKWLETLKVPSELESGV